MTTEQDSDVKQAWRFIQMRAKPGTFRGGNCKRRKIAWNTTSWSGYESRRFGLFFFLFFFGKKGTEIACSTWRYGHLPCQYSSTHVLSSAIEIVETINTRSCEGSNGTRRFNWNGHGLHSHLKIFDTLSRAFQHAGTLWKLFSSSLGAGGDGDFKNSRVCARVPDFSIFFRRPETFASVK